MLLKILPSGEVRCLYGEEIDLASLGRVNLRRASHVDQCNFEGTSTWCADLSPVNGPSLGPFTCRSQALAAEAAWLESNVL